jgi:hypothetical protein
MSPNSSPDCAPPTTTTPSSASAASAIGDGDHRTVADLKLRRELRSAAHMIITAIELHAPESLLWQTVRRAILMVLRADETRNPSA